MSRRTALTSQTLKLRDEIKRLKEALVVINKDESFEKETHPLPQSPQLEDSDATHQELCLPRQMPSQQEDSREHPRSQKVLRGVLQDAPREVPRNIVRDSAKEFSEDSRQAKAVSPPLETQLTTEQSLGTPRDPPYIASFGIFNSPEPPAHHVKESFDSFYEQKVDQEALLKEVQTLRAENQELKRKLRQVTRQSRRSVTPKREPARGRSKSPQQPVTPRRQEGSRPQSGVQKLKHCACCDMLLMKGLSTRACTRHGSLAQLSRTSKM